MALLGSALMSNNSYGAQGAATASASTITDPACRATAALPPAYLRSAHQLVWLCTYASESFNTTTIFAPAHLPSVHFTDRRHLDAHDADLVTPHAFDAFWHKLLRYHCVEVDDIDSVGYSFVLCLFSYDDPRAGVFDWNENVPLTPEIPPFPTWPPSPTWPPTPGIAKPPTWLPLPAPAPYLPPDFEDTIWLHDTDLGK